MLGRNKLKREGELTLTYENERFTVKNDHYTLLDNCHADDCICLLIGLSTLFPDDIIKEALKISAAEEKKLPKYDDAIKSADVTLEENDIVVSKDDLNVVSVKYQNRLLFEGTYSDSIQVITSIGVLIGNRTAYQIIKDPDSVTQIVFGF